MAWLAVAMVPVQAQQHRAVRLGHPATRFAPPLIQPEQLRTLLTNETLRADVASILLQAGWKGSVDDLRRAAATAPIIEVSLPTGTRMPFMSSRKDGKPIALMDVLWAGDEPISAYAFEFSSNHRRYRCITPRPCSNFYVVDLGPASPELAVECSAPAETTVGRRFEVCLAVTNKGTAAESNTILRLQLPDDITWIGNPRAEEGESTPAWTIADLQPGVATQVCASFMSRQAVPLAFVATVQGTSGSTATSRCETQVAGIPAILLETADLDDPIEIGKEVVYEIKVTNQGSAPGTNLKVTCTLPDSEEFMSGTGPTVSQAEGRTVTMGTVSVLAPKSQAVWRVTVKALKADDARFKVFVSSDQFQQPIRKDEATQLY